MEHGRGSQRLLEAWKSRGLTDEAFGEIVAGVDESPAAVEAVRVHGGAAGSGVTARFAYDGEEVPSCGDDLRFWLLWHLRHGGGPRPPRIIIEGTPVPERVLMDPDVGWPGEPSEPAEPAAPRF